MTPTVSVIGLPESGKTTYLAALWHLVNAAGSSASPGLRLKNLKSGDLTYLNAIADRWRDAKEQERTVLGGSRLVSMNLQDATGDAVQVTFPDVPGEAYLRMWEERECEEEVAELLRSTGVLLFIHSDTIKSPRWIVDDAAIVDGMGEIDQAVPAQATEESVAWQPSMAPTQVQLVDLLQLLRRPPLDIGPRKLAVMFSAWDKGEGDGLDVRQFLEVKLPLLDQYLSRNVDGWDVAIFGVSAQGGEYDSNKTNIAPRAEAATLRQLDDPSQRVKLTTLAEVSNDLTVPIQWLMA